MQNHPWQCRHASVHIKEASPRLFWRQDMTTALQIKLPINAFLICTPKSCPKSAVYSLDVWTLKKFAMGFAFPAAVLWAGSTWNTDLKNLSKLTFPLPVKLYLMTDGYLRGFLLLWLNVSAALLGLRGSLTCKHSHDAFRWLAGWFWNLVSVSIHVRLFLFRFRCKSLMGPSGLLQLHRGHGNRTGTADGAVTADRKWGKVSKHGSVAHVT